MRRRQLVARRLEDRQRPREPESPPRGETAGVESPLIAEDFALEPEEVPDVVIVEDAHVRDVEFSVRIVKMDPDRAVPNWTHPEDVVAIDVYVVVVDLRWERSRSNRTGVQIESNKDLRALMHAAVRTDEFTLTKTHVRLIRQWNG